MIRVAIAGFSRVLSRTIRAVRIVVGDGRIPRPIRWLAAVGLLPIPGPFDEAVLLLVALILLAFYRPQLRRAWREAGARPAADPGPDGFRTSRRSGRE